MKIRNIIICLATLTGLLSCEKEDIKKFNNQEAGIYFQQMMRTDIILNSEEYFDSLAYSFSTARPSQVDTIINIRIRTMGEVKDYPRPVKLSIVKEHTSATVDMHYDVDLNSVVIPAGQSEVYLKVRCIRSADLLGELVNIEFKLEDNEHFKTYIKEQKNTNVYTTVGKMISADRFKLSISEIYRRPSYWSLLDGDWGENLLGPWSISKFKLVNELTGWSPADWATAGDDSSPVKLGRFNALVLIMRNELQRLADLGTPMLDDDGKPMQLGPDYLVNY